MATTINLADAAAQKIAAGKISETSLNSALAAVGLPAAVLTSAPAISTSGAPRTPHTWALASILLGLTVFSFP